IPWESLQIQFGADYGRLRDFKKKFLAHLSEVLKVYPSARLTWTPIGILLKPSPCHVRRSNSLTFPGS
ncbi:MAG: hypothetical protein ACYTEG_08730, partial [Planctomycetota bacterium]